MLKPVFACLLVLMTGLFACKQEVLQRIMPSQAGSAPEAASDESAPADSGPFEVMETPSFRMDALEQERKEKADLYQEDPLNGNWQGFVPLPGFIGCRISAVVTDAGPTTKYIAGHISFEGENAAAHRQVFSGMVVDGAFRTSIKGHSRLHGPCTGSINGKLHAGLGEGTFTLNCRGMSEPLVTAYTISLQR